MSESSNSRVAPPPVPPGVRSARAAPAARPGPSPPQSPTAAALGPAAAPGAEAAQAHAAASAGAVALDVAATPGTAGKPMLGRYHLLGPIASGGMAEILLAKMIGPSGFERPVVIKRILPHLARRAQFVEMFLDEARIIAAIRHPNVVQVQELGRDGEDLCLVMEYLEGESLGGLMKRLVATGRRLDPIVGAHVIAEACAGLDAAHELRNADGKPLNIVHRDVSPQNIFLTYDGAVKVLDFGIAKATDRATRTEAGQVKGKFAYMSPEQCRGEALDRRTDIFALGIALYEITVGARLFGRATDMQTLEAVCYEGIKKPTDVIPGFPAQLEAIALRALERKPERRYATAADMRRDLVRAMMEMGSDGMIAERLAQLTRELFADRVMEKREMLRRVRAGSAVTHVPAADIDSGISIPVAFESQRPTMAVTSGVHRRSDPPKRGRGRRATMIALAVAAALVGVGVPTYMLTSPGGAPDASEEVPAAVEAGREFDDGEPVPSPSLGDDDRQGTLGAGGDAVETATIHTVSVTVESEPTGAVVEVDGTERGQTPVTLELPRSEDPVAIRLARPGYADLDERVVPDGDQRLRLAMTRARSTRPPTRRNPRSPPAAVAATPASEPAARPRFRAFQ